jgi:hypothetical protein
MAEVGVGCFCVCCLAPDLTKVVSAFLASADSAPGLCGGVKQGT